MMNLYCDTQFAAPTDNNSLKMYLCLAKSPEDCKILFWHHTWQRNMTHLRCFIKLSIIMNIIVKSLCHSMRLLFCSLKGCVIFIPIEVMHFCFLTAQHVLTVMHSATGSTYFTIDHILHWKANHVDHNTNSNADRNYNSLHRVH